MNATDIADMIAGYTALGAAGYSGGRLLYDPSTPHVVLFGVAATVLVAVTLRRPVSRVLGRTRYARRRASRGMDSATREVFLALWDAGLYPRCEDAIDGIVKIQRRNGVFNVEKKVVTIDDYNEEGVPAGPYRRVRETWLVWGDTPGWMEEEFKTLGQAVERTVELVEHACMFSRRMNPAQWWEIDKWL